MEWAVIGLTLALLGPAQSETEDEPSLTDELLRVEVRLDGAPDKTILSMGFGETVGLTAYQFDTEGREGVAAVVGGYGAIAGPGGGKAGLTFLFFIHFYTDGDHFIEAQLLNDATNDPPGRLTAFYRVEFRGEVLGAGKNDFADQTGVGFHGGRVKAAPRPDLWEAYVATLPEPGSIEGIVTTDALPGADPDPIQDAAEVEDGKRNGWHSVAAAKYHLAEDERYLSRLMDFVDRQAMRPYHLSELNGEPFFDDKYPDAQFVDGRPELVAYRETFGRLLLPQTVLRGNGYSAWSPDRVTGEDLYAAYALLGSRIARRELVLIAEQLLTTPPVKGSRAAQGSARKFGRTARLLLRAYQATGEERYIEAVRRMEESLRHHWSQGGLFRALAPQPPRAEWGNEWSESPADVAVATAALILHLQIDPENDDAEELLEFCADLIVDQGFSPSQGGFYDRYSVESSSRVGDGSRVDGAVRYVTSTLVDAAALLPPERSDKYLEPARNIYEAQVESGLAVPTNNEFYRWFLSAAKGLDD